MEEQTSQEREDYSMGSIEEDNDVVPRHDEESDIALIHNASEEQDRSDESVTVYDDNENKVSYSNLSIYDIYYPYIIAIKFWQAHSVAWIDAYNEFLKAWIDNIRLTASTYEEFNSNRNKMLNITDT